VEKLLEQKALNNARVADEKGQTALHNAVLWGDQQLVGSLSSHDYKLAYDKDSTGCTAINLAAQEGHTDIFKELFHRSVDATTNSGMNALHIAVSFKNREILRYITKEKEPVKRLINQQDKNGNTPLHLAVLKGTFQGLPRLLKLAA